MLKSTSHIISVAFVALFILVSAKRILAQEIDTSYITQPLKIPFIYTYNIHSLTKRITKNDNTELQKVKSIFRWIATNIDYDHKVLQQWGGKKKSPKQILRRKKTVCEGYADLFVAMCKEAEVDALKIVGYSKTGENDIGDPFFKAEHAWNAVKIDGKWFLLDITWSSGIFVVRRKLIAWFVLRVFHVPFVNPAYKFKKRLSGRYFLIAPDKFFIDHCPITPIWQLSPNPKTMYRFESDSLFCYTQDTLSLYNNYSLVNFNDANRDYLDTEFGRLIRNAKEANAFNPKNNRIVAYAETIHGDTLIKRVKKGDDLIVKLEKYENALPHYEEGYYYASCQQSDLKAELNHLRKKNKDKNKLQLAEYKNLFAENKRLLAVNRRISNAAHKEKIQLQSKKAKFRSEIKKANKQTELSHFNKEVTQTVENISDSISLLEKHIGSIHRENKALLHDIETIKYKTDINYDSLETLCKISSLKITNSILLRLNQFDDFDHEIRKNRDTILLLKSESANFISKVKELYTDSLVQLEQTIYTNYSKILDYRKEKLMLIIQGSSIDSNPKWMNSYHQERSLVLQLNDSLATFLNENKKHCEQIKNSSKRIKRLIIGRKIFVLGQNKLLYFDRKIENRRKAIEQRKISYRYRVDLKRNIKLKKYIRIRARQCKKNINAITIEIQKQERENARTPE